jgi:hypothetical protein
MTTGTGSVYIGHAQPPESLLTLAEYLELSLDEGQCVVMIRRGKDVCAVYVGDPAGLPDELTSYGTIASGLAEKILEITQAGVNRIMIGDQAYRFVRSFTHIDKDGAIVFAPA